MAPDAKAPIPSQTHVHSFGFANLAIKIAIENAIKDVKFVGMQYERTSHMPIISILLKIFSVSGRKTGLYLIRSKAKGR